MITTKVIKDGKIAVELFLLVLPSFIYVVISTIVPSYIKCRNKMYIYIIEYLLLVFPIILKITVLSNFGVNISYAVCISLFEIIILIIIKISLPETKTTLTKLSNNHFITNVRSTINLISIIAILAVDFKIFPTRFSKTSETGFSLMDVGVGLYVFSNAIVAPETKGKKSSVKQSFKNSMLLILIGILRMILTKATNYNVSELEYGVHWNFFITLAVTKICTAYILSIFDIDNILVNTIVLNFFYEVLLQMSLKNWIFSKAKRTNIISANKEGIVSSIGYICLYLYSLYFSYKLNKIKNSKSKNSNIYFLTWISISLGFTTFCAIHLEVSRRLANSGYVAWVLFIAIFMTWLFYCWDIFITGFSKKYNFKHCPYVYEAINYNGLLFFIVGNFLTGLINLSISTVLISSINSLLIILTYMFINCSVVLVLYHMEFKLKF
ncbi:uncharacterized protein LOC143192901 [Rhynchophorus ferrugineus]|uniref:uncharacterized protein LOC143192901 n=1 Tax=Rhynchophorus ferrugineus TaxID=354439 RepID=UPI003FCCA696